MIVNTIGAGFNGKVGVLPLTEIRTAAFAALEPQSEGDPAVLVDVVDALTPPAIMLLWDDPWLQPGGSAGPVMGPCLWSARLLVLCVAGRLEPGPGVAELERLISYVVTRLRDDLAYTWPVASALAPRVFDIGGVPYLGARVTYSVPASIEES
jgi:hypothetical protein